MTTETLVIERHGAPIGFFVPISAVDRRSGREMLGRLGELTDLVLGQSGLTEDDFVDELLEDVVPSHRPR